MRSTSIAQGPTGVRRSVGHLWGAAATVQVSMIMPALTAPSAQVRVFEERDVRSSFESQLTGRLS